MIKVLFVCHGNICRSPLGEFILKDLVKQMGFENDFYIESAATTREEIGNPIYPPALAELRKHGIGTSMNEAGVSKKRARQLTKADYQNFDYIIGMDRENAFDMPRILGDDVDNKVSLLLDWTGEYRDVADPWYTRDFSKTWDDVMRGCLAFLEQVHGE